MLCFKSTLFVHVWELFLIPTTKDLIGTIVANNFNTRRLKEVSLEILKLELVW